MDEALLPGTLYSLPLGFDDVKLKTSLSLLSSSLSASLSVCFDDDLCPMMMFSEGLCSLTLYCLEMLLFSSSRWLIVCFSVL